MFGEQQLLSLRSRRRQREGSDSFETDRQDIERAAIVGSSAAEPSPSLGRLTSGAMNMSKMRATTLAGAAS